MKSHRRVASLALVSFIVSAVLVGCSGPTDGGGADEVGGSTGELGDTGSDDLAIGGDTRCISGRTWELDLPDLASQIATQLATTGFGVIEYAGIGSNTLIFDEAGTLNASVNSTISITVTTDAGATITLVQIHEGAPFGDWGWRGNTNVMEFANWNSGGYTVQNLMTINGVSGESSIPIPSDPLSGTAMTVECSGSKMTTITESSPYIQRWTTED